MHALAPLVLCGVLTADPTPLPKVPVDAAGHPDYEAGLNDRMGKGITPEKNANVLIWKAFGPTPEGGTGMPPEFFKRLGIAEPPKDGDYFVGTYRFVNDHLKLDPSEKDVFFTQQNNAGQRPWTAKDYPHIATWLKLNEKPLAVVIEATKRPQYFNPLVSLKKEGEPGSLIGALLPAVQKCREAGSALTARAMLRLAEGKTDEAWQDILAAHRLGRLVARGGTLIEALVGIAIDTVASNAAVAYLDNAKLTAKQLQERLKDLQALPPMPPMADKLDLGERFMYFDSLQLIRRGGIGQLEQLAKGPIKKVTDEDLKALAMIDWEPAFKLGNEWYDRMAAAMRLKTRAERQKAFDKIEADLKALKKDSKAPAIIAKVLLGRKPDKEVGEAIGNILIALLAPAFNRVQDAHDRSEQIQRNLHVAFALAAYRADNGKYPAKLTDLAPKYLASVPDDVFTGKALIYKPSEKGFLLYSVGVNGQDDGGRWVDDEPRGDDPRIRLPLK